MDIQLKWLNIEFEWERLISIPFPRDSSMCLSVYMCHSERIRGFKAKSFPLKYNPRHPNVRSTPLKLIYIISSTYKPKIKCFEDFLLAHQVEKKRMT